MAVREILVYPGDQAALRRRSQAIRKVSPNTRRLIEDLKDTLHVHPDGVGLAAPQINIPRRVVVVRLGARGEGNAGAGPPIALINPRVIETRDERKDFDGCLSFPGLFGATTRPHYLRVVGRDEAGRPFDRVFEGFDAVVVHHEIDHLDGVLFIDRVERAEDLYRVRADASGQLVRVPVHALRW